MVASTKQQSRSKQANKRKRQLKSEDEEEKRLTSMVFGEKKWREEDEEARIEAIEEPNSDALFQIDRTGDDDEENDENEGDNGANQDNTADDPEESSEGGDKPVWEDEDDDIEVNLSSTSRLAKLRRNRKEGFLPNHSNLEARLRKRYEQTAQLGARTDWADLSTMTKDPTDTVESAESLLRDRSLLPRNTLNAMRCPDANQADPNHAAIQALHFHPGSDPDSPLLLTAGFDKTLRFFQVGEKSSKKIHGIHCKWRTDTIFSRCILSTHL